MGTLEARPHAFASSTWRLPRLGSVNAVGLEAHAEALSHYEVEGALEQRLLAFAVQVVDLTPDEGAWTEGAAQELCAKALRPDPFDASVAPVAAVCVDPRLAIACRGRLGAGGVRLAATLRCAGSPLDLEVAEARRALALGADEIELAIDHGAFLAGRHASLYAELAALRQAVGRAPLKVVIDVSSLGTYEDVRHAALLAIAAGADFVGAASGWTRPVPPLAAALCVLEAIRDVHEETGVVVGFKAADGVQTAEDAVAHLVLVHETLGPDWLTPARLRLAGPPRLLAGVLARLAGCG